MSVEWRSLPSLLIRLCDSQKAEWRSLPLLSFRLCDSQKAEWRSLPSLVIRLCDTQKANGQVGVIGVSLLSCMIVFAMI